MLFTLTSCNVNHKDSINLRVKLEESYRKTELEEGVKITCFAHIGEVKTKNNIYWTKPLRGRNFTDTVDF